MKIVNVFYCMPSIYDSTKPKVSKHFFNAHIIKIHNKLYNIVKSL